MLFEMDQGTEGVGLEVVEEAHSALFSFSDPSASLPPLPSTSHREKSLPDLNSLCISSPFLSKRRYILLGTCILFQHFFNKSCSVGDLNRKPELPYEYISPTTTEQDNHSHTSGPLQRDHHAQGTPDAEHQLGTITQELAYKAGRQGLSIQNTTRDCHVRVLNFDTSTTIQTPLC